MSYMGEKYRAALRKGYNTKELARAYGVSECEIYNEMAKFDHIETKPLRLPAGPLPFAGKPKGNYH